MYSSSQGLLPGTLMSIVHLQALLTGIRLTNQSSPHIMPPFQDLKSRCQHGCEDIVHEAIFKRGLYKVLVYPPPYTWFVNFIRYVGICGAYTAVLSLIRYNTFYVLGVI